MVSAPAGGDRFACGHLLRWAPVVGPGERYARNDSCLGILLQLPVNSRQHGYVLFLQRPVLLHGLICDGAAVDFCRPLGALNNRTSIPGPPGPGQDCIGPPALTCWIDILVAGRLPLSRLFPMHPDVHCDFPLIRSAMYCLFSLHLSCRIRSANSTRVVPSHCSSNVQGCPCMTTCTYMAYVSAKSSYTLVDA